MPSPTPDVVIERFIQVRDKRAELKRAYEAEDFKLKQAAEKLEGWLLSRLNDQKVDSFKTAQGTAYIAVETKASCADWPSFWQFIIQTGNPQLLEKRVAIGAIKEYEENTGSLPPYVNKVEERVVRVRRT